MVFDKKEKEKENGLGLSSERISPTWTLSFFAPYNHTPPPQVIQSVDDSTHPVADKDASTPGPEPSVESLSEVLVDLLSPHLQHF